MKTIHPPLTKEQTSAIIDAFKHDLDNRTKVLAGKFNVPLHQINDVINRYLRLQLKKIEKL